MSPMLNRILGVLLIAAGTAGLALGEFRYERERKQVNLGPIELAVRDTERVAIPPWAGIGAIAAGTLLLLVGGRKR
jgi:uncharacterized membrane protein YidH (DUF202 family)